MKDKTCSHCTECDRPANWCNPERCTRYARAAECLEDIVFNTVQTFRPGSPIIADDIRFAATVDGHDMRQYTNAEIAHELAKWCHVRLGPYGIKDRRSFYRKTEGVIV